MTLIRSLLSCCALSLAPVAVAALPLEFPSTATRAVTQSESFGSQRLPISGFVDGGMQTIWAEGEIRTDAWHMAHGGMTTLQILAPLRAQLSEAGYETIFECAADDCGGFDFRYALPVLPEPDMHVDLGDFRYLTAQRSAGDTPDFVTLMVSRSRERGFVQVTAIGALQPMPDPPVTSTKSPIAAGDLDVEAAKAEATALSLPAAEMPPMPDRLETDGRAVLAGLRFATGSANLQDPGGSSLDELARYLIDRPDRSIVLVGHTDDEGALDGNIALSRKRADAVRAHLVEALGVPAAQVRAEGVGFLSPLTTNDTAAGRSVNRRVEVILK